MIATILWGSAFAAQRSAMTIIDPAKFIVLRSLVGVIALIPVVMCVDLTVLKKLSFWGEASTPAARRKLLLGGMLCGAAITPAMLLQQMGLRETPAGKSGFLTALYMIIVPLLGIFFKRKTSVWLWIATAMAFAGSFLLCYKPGNIWFSRGDILVIGCAFMYALHILIIDFFAGSCDCIRLSLLQFAAATVIVAVITPFYGDTWNLAAVGGAAKYWLFCGIGSSAIAFTLQIVAQRYLHPVTTSLQMSLESVFALLAGWVFLRESMQLTEAAGAVIVLAAVIMAQLPEIKRS